MFDGFFAFKADAEQLTARDHRDSAALAICDALNWAIELDRHFAEHWHPHGKRLGSAWTIEAGQTAHFAALRFVNARVRDGDWRDALALGAEGWTWRSADDLPGHAEACSDPTGYVREIQGRSALATLAVIASPIEQMRRILAPGTADGASPCS